MAAEEETCNSRHLSRLMKSCFPNPNHSSHIPRPKHHHHPHHHRPSLSSLPDDILLEIISRLPLSSLPSLSSVSRRFLRLLHSPFLLHLRRRHLLLHPTLFAFSPSSSSSSSLRPLLHSHWKSLSLNHTLFNNTHSHLHLHFSHSRFVSLGRFVFIISRSGSLVFDPWTGSLRLRSGLVFPRKRFAAAAVGGRIYVSGGSATASAVEEYDPDKDEWRVVSHAPRRRYGCIGVGVDGVFYVIGGLKIGGTCDSRASLAGAEARAYASSMDLYDVAARGWLRSRAVPGGGCVVAACGAYGFVYVLASHAVELSFWRFNARRKSDCKNGGAWGGGFGEWCRVKSPPVPTQVRLDGTVRFTCVGVNDKVVLIQVMGCIDDLLRRSGRNVRGCKEGLVLIFDCVTQEWSRGPDLPHYIHRPACVCVEC